MSITLVELNKTMDIAGTIFLIIKLCILDKHKLVAIHGWFIGAMYHSTSLRGLKLQLNLLKMSKDHMLFCMFV